MRCRVCGGAQEFKITDLPFKTGDSSIVIVKATPVLQCCQCGEIELEQAVMVRVEQFLDSADKLAELEIVRFAA